MTDKQASYMVTDVGVDSITVFRYFNNLVVLESDNTCSVHTYIIAFGIMAALIYCV